MLVYVCAESQWEKPEGFKSQSDSSAQAGEQSEVDKNDQTLHVIAISRTATIHLLVVKR